MNPYAWIATRFGPATANLAVIGFRAFLLVAIVLLSDQKQHSFAYLQI